MATHTVTPVAIAHIETLLEVMCCSSNLAGPGAAESISMDVPAASGGRELCKLACDRCGSEYMFGVIARTREQSLADEAFEHVNEDVLDDIGVDKTDFDAPADEVRMCARCDGTAAGDELCRGCGEYVHATCRLRVPRRMNAHAAEEHWQEPKTQLAIAADNDDGSVMTGDDAIDFVAEQD